MVSLTWRTAGSADFPHRSQTVVIAFAMGGEYAGEGRQERLPGGLLVAEVAVELEAEVLLGHGDAGVVQEGLYAGHGAVVAGRTQLLVHRPGPGPSEGVEAFLSASAVGVTYLVADALEGPLDDVLEVGGLPVGAARLLGGPFPGAVGASTVGDTGLGGDEVPVGLQGPGEAGVGGEPGPQLGVEFAAERHGVAVGGLVDLDFDAAGLEVDVADAEGGDFGLAEHEEQAEGDGCAVAGVVVAGGVRSEEHTSELQSAPFGAADLAEASAGE